MLGEGEIRRGCCNFWFEQRCFRWCDRVTREAFCIPRHRVLSHTCAEWEHPGALIPAERGEDELQPCGDVLGWISSLPGSL